MVQVVNFSDTMVSEIPKVSARYFSWRFTHLLLKNKRFWNGAYIACITNLNVKIVKHFTKQACQKIVMALVYTV